MIDRDIGFIFSHPRSGTKTLSEIVGRVSGVKSYHDKTRPLMTRGNNVEKWLHGAEEERGVVYERFADHLNSKVRPALVDNDFYFESDQNFVHTYAEIALKYIGHRIKIVHLMRNSLLQAKSLYETGHCPSMCGGDGMTDRWVLNPSYKRNYWRIPDSSFWDQEMDDYHTGLWQFFEKEFRSWKTKKWYRKKDVPIFMMRTSDLNDESVVSDMMKFLGLEDRFGGEGVGEVINSKDRDRQYDIDEIMNLSEGFFEEITDGDSELRRKSEFREEGLEYLMVNSFSEWFEVDMVEDVATRLLEEVEKDVCFDSESSTFVRR